MVREAGESGLSTIKARTASRKKQAPPPLPSEAMENPVVRAAWTGSKDFLEKEKPGTSTAIPEAHQNLCAIPTFTESVLAFLSPSAGFE